MKKKLISIVAAVALLGSVSLATAGTITTSGDTNIQIGGFINQMFIWGNNQSGLSLAPNAPSVGKPASTSFSSSANWTRLDLNLNNSTEGITGEISGDKVCFIFRWTASDMSIIDKPKRSMKEALYKCE